MRIFPSLMMVHEHQLAATVALLEACVDGFHIDIMDGVFVSARSGSPDTIISMRHLTGLPLWVHLMVKHPRTFITRARKIGLEKEDIISIHYEAYDNDADLVADLNIIKDQGLLAGIAVSPATPLEAVEGYADRVDHITLMGVVPGKSGQLVLPETCQRLRRLAALRKERCLSFRIGLDGGVSPTALGALAPYKPDDIAAATSIVHAADPCQAVADLQAAAVSIFTEL
jgi:ribulose-phosphate 3-epimerase